MQLVIDVESLPALERRLQETLCLMEAFFPLMFLDIMVHLTIRLVKEVHYLAPSYLLKAIGCSSLRGGGGELGTIKTLTFGSN